MKKLTVVLMLVLMTGCAGFKVKATNTLAVAQNAAISARETLLPIADGLCAGIAQTCRETADLECKPLNTCQQVRRKVITSIIAIHYAILDANTALAIGDEDNTWAAIDKALDLIRQLRIHMRSLGIGA